MAALVVGVGLVAAAGCSSGGGSDASTGKQAACMFEFSIGMAPAYLQSTGCKFMPAPDGGVMPVCSHSCQSLIEAQDSSPKTTLGG